MAIDKTNNLAAFLDDIADGIRVAETGSATPDNNDIPAQSFRSRIEALPATVRPDVERAGTTIKVTADDTNDKLTIAAANN
jgi:hypothetical protein